MTLILGNGIIERLWKFVKKTSLYSQEFSSFEAFWDEIKRCIENVHVEHKEELESLLTWKFQTLPEFNRAVLPQALKKAT